MGLPTERALSQHTRMMCERGVYVDKAKFETGMLALDNALTDAELGIPWSASSPPLSAKALREACAEAGIPVPKSSAEAQRIVTDFRRSNPLITSLKGEVAKTTSATK